MKVLIIGLGSIARKHIAALRRLAADVEIEALRSASTSRPEPGVRDIHELPAEPDHDFIIISNPTALHADAIRATMDTGKPLFIEKPVFESLRHQALAEELAKRGNLTYTACNLRFLGCLQYVKEHLVSHPDRRINEVNVYCGSYLPEWRPGTDFRQHYSARADMGGGVDLDLIHELDYVCWLFGRPLETTGTARRRSTLGIDAPDYAHYLLTYDTFAATVTLNYYRRDYKRTLEIVFDDETWTADLKRNTVTTAEGTTLYAGGEEDTYLKQMDYFLGLLRSGDRADNDITYAFDTLKLALKHEGPQR